MNNSVTNKGSYFVKFRGDTKHWIWRKIEKHDTFRILKLKYLQSPEVVNDETNTLQFESLVICIHFLSTLRSNKLPLYPMDSENVLDVISKEELYWPGAVVLTVSDRISAYPEVVRRSKLRFTVPLPYVPPTKSECCTEWPFTNFPVQPQGQLNQFGSPVELAPWETDCFHAFYQAKCHGLLQRRINVEGKVDVWRDEYCVLVRNAVWIANMKNWESDKNFSRIPLPPETMAKPISGSSGVFVITTRGSVESDAEGGIVFRAKSSGLVADWVAQINQCCSEAQCDYIDKIAELEGEISRAELDNEFAGLNDESRWIVEGVSDQVLTVPISEHFSVHDTNFHFSYTSLSSPSIFTNPCIRILKCGLMKCCIRSRVAASASAGGYYSPIGKMASMSSISIGNLQMASPTSSQNTNRNAFSTKSMQLQSADDASSSRWGRFGRLSSANQGEDSPGTPGNNQGGFEGISQYCILLELGTQGYLLLFDPQAGFTLTASIEIGLIDKVVLPAKMLNAIEFFDKTGVIWTFLPTHVDEDDEVTVCDRWLACIAKVLPATAGKCPRIVHSGYLMKRGALNTSFKRRWLVLTSTGYLRYYNRDMLLWKFKGQLNLSNVTSLSTSAQETGPAALIPWRTLFKTESTPTSQKMELTLWTRERLWVFQANSSAECKLWHDYIQTILAEAMFGADDNLSIGGDLEGVGGGMHAADDSDGDDA